MHLEPKSMVSTNLRIDVTVLAHIQRLQASIPMGVEMHLGANYRLAAPLDRPPSAILRQRSGG